MTEFWRRTLGILALGGGAVGTTLIFMQLFADLPLASKIIMLLFMPLYLWGIWCGVQMLERHPNAMRNNLRFWVIQIPILQSSVLSYLFSAGAVIGAWLQLSPTRIHFLAWAGSRFELSINQSKPLALGVNVVAVVASLVLWRLLRAQIPNNSSKPPHRSSS